MYLKKIFGISKKRSRIILTVVRGAKNNLSLKSIYIINKENCKRNLIGAVSICMSYSKSGRSQKLELI